MSTEKNGAGNIELGPGKEFDLVRTLLAEWGKSAQHIGDDAAIVEVPAGEKLVITTDTSVDGVHFRHEWLNHFEIGYRATAAALSDLAAMGARPLGIVIALTLPEADRVEARALATGIREGASAVLCPIVGGDLSSGKTLSLTITALGGVARPLSRGGAKAGQRVYVTGLPRRSGRGGARLARGKGADRAGPGALCQSGSPHRAGGGAGSARRHFRD